jgi:2-C-methyl-D-erythritol 4-phosphate cytidylyltransferase
MRATAVIVAAGEGSRLKAPVSKPYVPLAGRPLILHTIARFAAAQTITSVVLVVGQGDLGRCEEMVRADPSLSHLPWIIEAGGRTRQESVHRGLQRVALDCEIVVIHDGARPFVSPSLIDRCVDEAQAKGAVVIGLRARDTIKSVSELRKVLSTPDRDSLWEIQTPQAFQRDVIVQAHQWATENAIHGTDDATLVERLGNAVYVLDGEITNLKVTVPEDLLWAETLIRTGRVS